MKSPTAFLVSVLGCMLGCMILSGTIYAEDEADLQLPPESFLSQDEQQQSDISPSQMAQQESTNSDSTADFTDDSMPEEDSVEQIEAKKLEVELRKMLLLSCPR